LTQRHLRTSRFAGGTVAAQYAQKAAMEILKNALGLKFIQFFLLF